MKSLLALLTLSLMIPQLARAEAGGVNGAPTPEELEQGYQLLCVPGSAALKSVPADKVDETTKSIEQYHLFLANPEAVIGDAVKVLLSKEAGPMEKLGAALSAGIPCEMTKLLASDIDSRGCRNAAGEAHTSAKALAYCADMSKKVEEANK